MKKLIWILAASLLFSPACLLAGENIRDVRYENESITGVSASAAFQVELIQSDRTKAVLEIDEELQPYLRFSRDESGVVSVGVGALWNRMSKREQREFSRIMRIDRTMKLTLYLPHVNAIQLSGTSRLTASDAFSGDSINIRLSGSSSLPELEISGATLKMECSGSSTASLTVHLSDDLQVSASGSTHVNLTAFGISNSILSAFSNATLTIKGDGDQGNWRSGGAARIIGDDFVLKKLSVTTLGTSSVHANVTESLTTQSGGSSSVRYRGAPSHIQSSFGGSSVQPIP